MPTRRANRIDRTRHDFFYFFISIRYFLSYLEEYRKFKERDKDGKRRQQLENWIEKLADKESLTMEGAQNILKQFGVEDFTLNLFRLRTFGSITVVYAAMCLEAFINDYCVTKRSGNYFKKHVDKLSPVSKWVVVPKLVTGKEIPSTSQAIEYIRELYNQRNAFVHPKSKTIDEEFGWDKEFAKELGNIHISVYKSMGAIKAATHELYKLDPAFEYLKEYKWMWVKGAEVPKITDFQDFIKSFGGKV